jgi:hypothetical protein
MISLDEGDFEQYHSRVLKPHPLQIPVIIIASSVQLQNMVVETHP